MGTKELSFFTENIWEELNRYDASGEFIQTVTVTEENIYNLYNSQFPDKTKYGQIFYYTIFK